MKIPQIKEIKIIFINRLSSRKLFTLSSLLLILLTLPALLYLIQKNQDLRMRAYEKSVQLIPFEEVNLKKPQITKTLDIKASAKSATDYKPGEITLTGYWAGRKIRVISNDNFSNLFYNSSGIKAAQAMNDGRLFMGASSGFAIKNPADTSWSQLIYYDLSQIGLETVVSYFVPTLDTNYDVFLGQELTVRFTSNKTLEAVRDPTDIRGYLRNVTIVPYGSGKKILAYKDNELYYYNFETGIMRKWLTPARKPCNPGDASPRDLLASLRTLKDAKTGEFKTYALIQEAYCKPQYHLYEIIAEDKGPLQTIQLGTVSGNIDYLSSFKKSFLERRSDNSSEQILFGNPLYRSRLSYIPRFYTNGNPIEIQTAGIGPVGMAYDDFFVEKPKDYFTNVWVTAEQVGGVFLGDGFDTSPSSPQFIQSPSPETLLASPYVNAITGIDNGKTIVLGHKYLPGQFKNALVTLLEKPRESDVPAAFSQSLWLDGRGALQIAHHQSINTPNEFTIELRFNWLGINSGSEVLLWKDWNSASSSYAFWKQNDGKVLFRVWDGQRYSPQVSTISPIEASRWYHLAAVVKNNTVSLYLNGQLQGSTSFPGSVAFSAEPLYIGARGPGNLYGFSGMIDEVRISNNARYLDNFSPPTNPFSSDSNTSLLLHLDGNATDLSTNQNHGQLKRVYEFIGNLLTTTPIPTPTPSPCAIQPVSNPCPAANVCGAATCWRSSIESSNWSTCSQYDYDGDCNIDVIDIQKCSGKCKLDGSPGACCNSSYPCSPGLQCKVCYESLGMCQ